MIASASATALTTAVVTIAILMVGTWVVSLLLKNASIVDIVWGFGFVCVAWAVRFNVDGLAARQNLLVAMTTVWGLRLAGYLFWRNHGKPEDYRYRWSVLEPPIPARLRRVTRHVGWRLLRDLRRQRQHQRLVVGRDLLGRWQRRCRRGRWPRWQRWHRWQRRQQVVLRGRWRRRWRRRWRWWRSRRRW